MTEPTLSANGLELPLSMLAAFLKRSDAGGLFIINEKDLSSKTEISTGTIAPYIDAVLSLYSLTNPIMLTPCCPNAGPTGGAGVAFPASICNLINPITFFANLLFSTYFMLFQLVKNLIPQVFLYQKMRPKL